MLDKINLLFFRFIIYFALPFFLLKISSSFQGYFLFNYLISLVGVVYFLFFNLFLGYSLDKRFKIYYRTNSSIDRPLYRIFFSLSFLSVLSIPFNFIHNDYKYYFFISLWSILGFSYLLREKAKDSYTPIGVINEFKNFDNFERLSFMLVGFIILISFPGLISFTDNESLFNYYDTNSLLSDSFINFFKLIFSPLYKFDIKTSSFVYYIYFLFFLLIPSCFYSLLRYFYSRRLALLGLLTFVATWPLVKSIELEFLNTVLFSTWGVIFLWGTYWVLKSSSYRSGLFYGLLGSLGQMINSSSIFIFIILLIIFNFIFYKESSSWYRRQFFKYTILGLIGMSFTFLFQTSLLITENLNFVDSLLKLVEGKDILILFFPGLFLVIYNLWNKRNNQSERYQKWIQLLIISSCYILCSIYRSNIYIDFSFMLCFLIIVSLFPIAWIFRKLYGFRSRRNLIFATYIVICLLDSRLEARVKTILSFINLE